MRRTTTPAHDVNRFADERELESLRQLVRRELRVHGGQRTLAREIGIDRGSLRKFAAGQSTPAHWTLNRVRDWAENRPELSIPLSLVALALLVDDLAPTARPEARRRLAATLGDVYRATGEGVPTWITDELAGADLVEIAGGAASTSADRALLLRIKELVQDYDPAAEEDPA